jgi:NADH-ubiquinone oxidoreductase chain 4
VNYDDYKLPAVILLLFSRINLFSFYLFFESRLIPTVFLILGWGYQPERLQAGIYLLFYTLLASLPILVGIFYSYSVLGSTCFYLLIRLNSLSVLFYLCIVFSFLVKIPIFLVHL